MKVCEKCGDEIDGKDGENICPSCEQALERGKLRTKVKAQQRRERDDVMRSLGMVKVRGELGGTYWE